MRVTLKPDLRGVGLTVSYLLARSGDAAAMRWGLDRIMLWLVRSVPAQAATEERAEL